VEIRRQRNHNPLTADWGGKNKDTAIYVIDFRGLDLLSLSGDDEPFMHRNPSCLTLGVNIDHVATVRQARYAGYDRTCGTGVEPDPLELAFAAQMGGADGITVHLREDRRHIQDRDVLRLKEALSIPLNLEMAATPEMERIALELLPAKVCLVPEKRAELTTEGGLDALGMKSTLAPLVRNLSAAGIEVSLFLDPETAQLEVAADLGAPVVELHTGTYANARTLPEIEAAWRHLIEGAERGHALGLRINAGHGINYVNIHRMVHLPWLEELNIGHSIVARSLLTGMTAAVREMKRILEQAA
jgi:pyridoxine 5-phosphate synthase